MFAQLEALIGAGERFGLVILDPPKFARARNAVEEALRGYRRLQTLALRVLEKDGILATCCCSGLITLDMLEDVLATLYHVLGIDTTRQFTDNSGRPHAILNAGEAIAELVERS